jgi:hypothetical protein
MSTSMGAASADDARISQGRERLRQTRWRVRFLGTRWPWVDYLFAAVMLAFGAGAVALTGGKSAGWVVLAVFAVYGAFCVAAGLWSERHHDEVVRYWDARKQVTQATMRRHPVRWMIAMPIAVAVDAAAHWNRYHLRSLTSTIVVGAIGLLVGVVAAAFGIRRAERADRRQRSAG